MFIWLDWIIWHIIYFILLFDSINGFLLHTGQAIPLSQAIKIVLIFLISIRLVNRQSVYQLLLVFFYLFFMFAYWSVECPELLGDSLNTLFKFLSVVLMFLYIKQYVIKRPDFALKNIDKAISINIVVLIGNIILGILGIGYAQYGDSIGSRGFFYAGNEISGVMLVLFPYVLFRMKLLYSVTSYQYIIVAVLLVLTAMFAATKTAILGIVFTLCIIPVLNNAVNLSRSRRLKLFLFGTLFLFVLVYGGYYLIIDTELWERWSFFYEKQGLTYLLFSGRDEMVLSAMNTYLDSNAITCWLGRGQYDSVEVDPFDALFNYGIIGFFVVYSFYFTLLLKSNSLRKHSAYIFAPMVFLVDILLLVASSMAGHILFSGMSGVFIAILNGLMYYKLKPNNENMLDI